MKKYVTEEAEHFPRDVAYSFAPELEENKLTLRRSHIRTGGGPRSVSSWMGDAVAGVGPAMGFAFPSGGGNCSRAARSRRQGRVVG